METTSRRRGYPATISSVECHHGLGIGLGIGDETLLVHTIDTVDTIDAVGAVDAVN